MDPMNLVERIELNVQVMLLLPERMKDEDRTVPPPGQTSGLAR